MGNDQNIFPSKRPYGVWEMDGDKQVLVIYGTSTYDGMPFEKWRGEVTDSNIELIKLQIGGIPFRPEPVVPKDKQIQRLLVSQYGYIEGTVVADIMEVFND